MIDYKVRRNPRYLSFYVGLTDLFLFTFPNSIWKQSYRIRKECINAEEFWNFWKYFYLHKSRLQIRYCVEKKVAWKQAARFFLLSDCNKIWICKQYGSTRSLEQGMINLNAHLEKYSLRINNSIKVSQMHPRTRLYHVVCTSYSWMQLMKIVTSSYAYEASFQYASRARNRRGKSWRKSVSLSLVMLW